MPSTEQSQVAALDSAVSIGHSIDEQMATLGTRNYSVLDPARLARAQRAIDALAARKQALVKATHTVSATAQLAHSHLLGDGRAIY